MNGRVSGVSAQLQELHPNATFLTHCGHTTLLIRSLLHAGICSRRLKLHEYADITKISADLKIEPAKNKIVKIHQNCANSPPEDIKGHYRVAYY